MKSINDLMSKALQEEFCSKKHCHHLQLVFNVLTNEYEVYAWYMTTVASFDMWAAISYSVPEIQEWIDNTLEEWHIEDTIADFCAREY